MKIKFSKLEITHLIIALFIISFAFGFNDGRDVFELSFWLVNFMKILVFSAIALFVHIFAQKWVAKIYGFGCEFRLWTIRQWRFIPEPKFPKKWFKGKLELGGLPIGSIISVLVTVLSNGKLFFVAIGNYIITSSKSTRLGRKWVYISEAEESKVAMSGAMANIFVMILFKIFNYNNFFDDLIFINGMFALFSLIPIPPLDGGKLFISSRVWYVFVAVFAIFTVILITYLNALLVLIIAALLGLVLAGVYFYYYLHLPR
ncbi:MAG: hypothetical protein ABIF40_02930 [archaeon]